MGGHGTESGEPGRWIGPYRIVALLGEGGMGAVYLGRDGRGRVAAVKVLRPETARDEVMVRRFRREADAASAVRGPGVAPVLGYDLDGPVPWIAAAYLAGPTLHEAVTAYGTFSEAGARALLGELARGVTVIHEVGLVHRDLKPSNIVLTREGPRVIDFGIARPEYGLTLTQPGVAPATPGYAPPEQVTGRRAGPAADVFALGAVLVFTCTGRGPFGSGHPAAVGYRVVHEEPVLEGLPQGLTAMARACLAKAPRDRPTPGELATWAEKGTGRSQTGGAPPAAPGPAPSPRPAPPPHTPPPAPGSSPAGPGGAPPGQGTRPGPPPRTPHEDPASRSAGSPGTPPERAPWPAPPPRAPHLDPDSRLAGPDEAPPGQGTYPGPSPRVPHLDPGSRPAGSPGTPPGQAPWPEPPQHMPSPDPGSPPAGARRTPPGQGPRPEASDRALHPDPGSPPPGPPRTPTGPDSRPEASPPASDRYRPAPDASPHPRGPGPGAGTPSWLTPPLAADIDRRHAQAARLLRAAVPGGSPTRRRLLIAVAGLGVPGVGAGVWWLARDRVEGRGRAEDGVSVAGPLVSPTADVVPAALWRAEGLHAAGPAPVAAGGVVVAGTPDGVAGWAQDTGRRAWVRRTGEPPARASDLLTTGTAILVVTVDGRLTALDSRTGGVRWRTGGIGATQTLAVSDGAVYVLDRERRVRAVRLTDRQVAWTTADPLPGTGVARAAATRARLMVSTDDGVAHVLDTRDGRPAWRWEVGKPLIMSGGRYSAPAPAVHDGAFCVPGRPLALVDAHTGKARWTVDPGLGWSGAPTVAGGRVYAGVGGELWSMDARTGNIGWTVTMLYSGITLRSDVVLGNALYGLMGDPTYSTDGSGADAGVFTVDIRSGTLLWTFDDQADQPGWRLAGAAGRVFVARRTTLSAMPVL